MIRTPVSYSLDKQSRFATVTIPAVMPGINFFPLPYHPLYRFILSLGIVPDLDFNEKRKRYTAPDKYDVFRPETVESNWMHISANAEPITITLSSDHLPPDDNYTLILAVGIAYGTVGSYQTMEQVPEAGSAKILGAV